MISRGPSTTTPPASPRDCFRDSHNPNPTLNGKDITMTVGGNTSAPKAGKPQRTINDRLGWGTAGLSLALAAVLACASGLSDAAVILLDNTNASTMTLPTGAGTNVTIRSNRYFAYSFSTTSNQTLGSVTLGLVSDTGGLLTRDTTISLYNASGSLPSGAAIAQATSPVTVNGTPQYYTFVLPASFATIAGNSYSLAFAIDTAGDNNFRWNYGNPVAFPTGSNGVTFLGAAESNGTSWSAETVIKPTMLLEAAAVPEPSTCMFTGIALAGSLGYLRLRRRVGWGPARARPPGSREARRVGRNS